jgi:hypothetical protein
VHKHHRLDLKQMVLDNEGRPECFEMWPGNRMHLEKVIPVVERFEKRFGIHRVCIVADHGMISQGVWRNWRANTVSGIISLGCGCARR